MADWSTLVAGYLDGDLIYGLDGPRADVLKAFPKTAKKSTGCFGGLFKKKDKAPIRIQNDLTNAVFNCDRVTGLDPKADFYYSSKEIKKLSSDPKRAKEFKDFLKQHPKYNIEARPGDIDTLADYEPNPAKRGTNAWRRTSKAGLEFQTLNREMYVHFILDGLDMEAVVSKKGHGEGITSAEVRWLYRHRNDKKVMDHMKFWLDGELSPPPWERPEWKATFAKYIPKSEKKEDVVEEEQLAIIIDGALKEVDK